MYVPALRSGPIRPPGAPREASAGTHSYTAGMSNPVVALVVAAGMGTRFGGPLPKPVVPLGGSTVIGVAIDSLAAGGVDAVVVVISRNAEHHFIPALATCSLPLTVVTGGDTRQESVLRGLEAIAAHPRLSAARIVLVHDAVRPLVPADMVTRVIDAVGAGARAVTPALPVVDSLRRVGRDGQSSQVDRSELRAIQTPQGFDFPTLLASHQSAAARGVEATDDVGVCEAAGHQVTLVEGAATAFKITRAEDLDLARALIALRQDEAPQ